MYSIVGVVARKMRAPLLKKTDLIWRHLSPLAVLSPCTLGPFHSVGGKGVLRLGCSASALITPSYPPPHGLNIHFSPVSVAELRPSELKRKRIFAKQQREKQRELLKIGTPEIYFWIHFQRILTRASLASLLIQQSFSLALLLEVVGADDTRCQNTG